MQLNQTNLPKLLASTLDNFRDLISDPSSAAILDEEHCGPLVDVERVADLIERAGIVHGTVVNFAPIGYATPEKSQETSEQSQYVDLAGHVEKWSRKEGNLGVDSGLSATDYVIATISLKEINHRNRPMGYDPELAAGQYFDVLTDLRSSHPRAHMFTLRTQVDNTPEITFIFLSRYAELVQFVNDLDSIEDGVNVLCNLMRRGNWRK